MPAMNISQRALQIWSVLVLSAHNRQTITFEMLSKITGIPQQGLGQALFLIQDYCKQNNLPPLTALVVKSKTGLPGSGLPLADFPAALQKVFSYNWLGVGCPKPEDLKNAEKSRKKLRK